MSDKNDKNTIKFLMQRIDRVNIFVFVFMFAQLHIAYCIRLKLVRLGTGLKFHCIKFLIVNGAILSILSLLGSNLGM